MTLDDLLKLAKKPRRVLPVSVGGATVYVRGLSAADCEQAGKIAGAGDGDRVSLRTALLALAICEADGTPLCGDAAAHAQALGDLPASFVRRLDAAIDRASDVEPGTLENLVGNSPERTDGSDTASPANSNSPSPNGSSKPFRPESTPAGSVTSS